MPRKGFLAVLLLLVTMSFGQVSVRAQAAPSDDEFLRHVSQTHNVPLARLRMADRVAVEFSLTGVHLHKAKVIDTASGQAYQVALDNQHQPADLQAAADAETRAEVALYGKLDPRLYRLKAAAAATDRLPVSIWIEVPPPSFKRSSDRVSYHTALKKYLADHEKGLRDALAKRGISITISQLGPVIFANLTPAQIDWAAGHALVSRIYSAEEDNELAEANGVTTHRAYSVWASGNLGAGTAAKPVILDPYGVSDANPYLHNSTHSVVYWCSSVSARCPNGKNIGQHATAVAGVIASTHPMARGVAPAASAILSANTQDFSDSKVVEALEWGLANGGNPIIIPWSIECGGAQTSLSRYLDWAVRILHATIVVSTGNTATTCLDAANNLDPKLGENVSSPGVAWNVITVGSHTDGNTGFWLDDAMSAFSAWRNPEFAPGMEKPEVVAVGENIRTTDDTLAHDWLTQDGVNGTSFSAPLVAGQIALMLSRQPGQTVWPETNKAAVLASAFHDIAGGFAEQSEDGVGSVTMNHSDETYRLGRFVNGSRAGVPLQAADFPQNYENSMTLAAGDRVRVATVWDSISNGSTSDVLGADIDLCIRQPDDMTIIACSSSLENAWELVEFTAPVSGQYDILIDLYGSDVDWPGTFLGTAWAIESTPNFCTGTLDVSSSGGSYPVDTSNGPTLFDTYAGWDRTQSGREHVLKLVLEDTQHISLRDTNPHLDIHLVQFPSCGAEPLLPTMIGSGTDSVVVENAAPGIYYLVVDGADGAVGTTTLSVSNVLPPAAPDGLVAVGGNGVVNLSWSASAGADSYNVKRGTTNGGPYTTIAPDLTGTSFADNGVTAGTTYYYVATAVNAGGESLPSIQAHATPALAPPAPPATPDLQVASDTGSSSTDNLTNDTTPTFAGTAEDGVTVKILVDGVERGSGVATDGSYSVTTVPIAGGSHVITAQAINAAALASELSGILNITVDTTVPAATVPAQTIANNVQLGTSTVPVNLSWSASDANGITKYELQQSSNGGSTYTNVTLASATATVLTQALTPDTAGSYRFRVRATDAAGNISTYATGPSFLLKQHQEASTAVTYAGTWTLQTVSGASGGSVRYAAAAGTKATFSFTGRTVTWVSTKGTNRGRAEVWLDGARVATIDLYATATQTRRVVFSRDVSPSVAHTLEVRVLGTKAAASTATRVDLDALVVIE